MTVVAVHQPNFYPWLGYFNKIARCSHFVFLDHVQFQKTGGIWSNRVKLIVGGRPLWLTAPIVRSFHGVRAVAEIEFSAREPWRNKMLNTLRASYGRAPFFLETMTCLEPLIANVDGRLASYNRRAIVELVGHIGLKTPVWHSSSELAIAGRSTDLLAAITRAAGGDTYLCGGGAADYQQDSVFAAAGIALQYQHFQHPDYAQGHGGAFVAGLSVIDALMECGRERVRQMLSGPVASQNG